MYIKKKDREIIDNMNKHFKIPADFNKFVEKIGRLKCSLILKKGKTYTCTYCNHSYKGSTKVNDVDVCPNCKNTFKVKGFTTQYLLQDFEVGMLDKLENEFVTRHFFVNCYYSNGNFSYEYREYCRMFLNGRIFLNSAYQRGMYWEKVYVNYPVDKWRPKENYYLNPYSIYYYKNIKKLLQNTEYKYSNLWKLVKYTKGTYIEIRDLLNAIPTNPSIELLIKLKLYNLALDYKKYNIKGNFEKRFGVAKEYYKYMKKHNITSDELMILQNLKQKNIGLIRQILAKYEASKLDEFSKITKLSNLLKYSNILGTRFDFDLYLDYLENAKILGYNLKNKKYLFPDDLKEAHDFVVSRVSKNEAPYLNKSVEQRYIELSNKIYKNNLYLIRPPKDKKDFENEAKQQSNCVYTNYYEKHAKYKADIYFMRSISDENKSLITVEVKNNKIVQKRGKFNSAQANQKLIF